MIMDSSCYNAGEGLGHRHHKMLLQIIKLKALVLPIHSVTIYGKLSRGKLYGYRVKINGYL